NLVNAALTSVVPTIQVSNIYSHTTVQLGSAVPGQQSGALALPDARIVANHRSAHGLGVAVLQVPGHQFASVPLAYGSTLSSGEAVVVVGYPAAKAEAEGVTSGGPVAPEAVAGTVGDAMPEGGFTHRHRVHGRRHRRRRARQRRSGRRRRRQAGWRQ